jgi:hypothetical protein
MIRSNHLIKIYILCPVYISEALANLFEKILVFEINKEHREDDLKFGSKGESACSHGIVVLKILIKFIKRDCR